MRYPRLRFKMTSESRNGDARFWCTQSGIEKPLVINNFGRIVLGLGGPEKLSICFGQHANSLVGREDTQTRSPENPGTIPGHYCLCVLLFGVFLHSANSDSIEYRFWGLRGIMFGNYYRKLYSIIFLGEFISAM